jgi:Tol biopolymer transport system component
VRDRYGNTAERSTVSRRNGVGGTVSTSGAASATATGRYTVVATAAGVTDTVRFSAVPEATILAHDRSRGEIVTIGLDGSNRRVQTRVTDGGIGVRPRWVPGESTVIYSGYAEPFQSVFLLDSAGTPRPFVNSRPQGRTWQTLPLLTGRGYRRLRQQLRDAQYCLHRVRMDGTAMELLPAVRGRPEQTVRPSPSPDGRRVALNTLVAGIARLRVLDVVTGAFLPLDVPGAFPQWAPTGEMIAFLEGDGSLSVVNAGGPTPRRIVDGTGYLAGRAFTWSPDGVWIQTTGSRD